MSLPPLLPRLLIVDDLFGRSLHDRRNEERASLCGQYLLEDVTGDQVQRGPQQRIKNPIAQAVFHRGQRPLRARVGDLVENDLEEVLRVIRSGWTEPAAGQTCWSLVLLDLCFHTGSVTDASNRETAGMPEGQEADEQPQHYFGLQILRAIQQTMPDLPVILLSSHARDEVSQVFSRYGALGFLAREAAESPELLRDFLHRHGLIPDAAGLIVGQARPLLIALRAARRIARARGNVLIRGERGCGKELLARYLHQHSNATGGGRPFVTVNAGALSKELYGSTLFGHQRGAFTGAVADRVGVIAQASGGNLFLDEIGSLPPEIQAGLLRVLEYGEVAPVGAEQVQKVDTRFLSATNDDLDLQAAHGAFRSDLLDRLRLGGTLVLPPLRDRLADLPALVERFVREAEARTPGALIRRIDPDALDVLASYHWPGNVRELAICIANTVCEYPDVEHLVPVHLRLPAPVKGNRPPAVLVGAGSAAPVDQAQGLAELLARIQAFSFEGQRREHLIGKLPELQAALAGLLRRCLHAALELTARVGSSGDGPLRLEVLIHPALKLLTGDPRLSAATAADLIKRIMRLAPDDPDVLPADPLLREAYDNAQRLRPRKPRTRKTASETDG